jgi:predicted DNA-binding mobile mystery protein A
MFTESMRIALQGLEQRLGALRAAQASAGRPLRGWLRTVRDAVGLGQKEVANKLGVRRQSYAELETAEERDSVTLASLRRAAEAMECEFVYFLVPREPLASTFSELARRHDRMPKHPKTGELQAAGDLSLGPKEPSSVPGPFCLTLSQD